MQSLNHNILINNMGVNYRATKNWQSHVGSPAFLIYSYNKRYSSDLLKTTFSISNSWILSNKRKEKMCTVVTCLPMWVSKSSHWGTPQGQLLPPDALSGVTSACMLLDRPSGIWTHQEQVPELLYMSKLSYWADTVQGRQQEKKEIKEGRFQDQICDDLNGWSIAKTGQGLVQSEAVVHITIDAF